MRPLLCRPIEPRPSRAAAQIPVSSIVPPGWHPLECDPKPLVVTPEIRAEWERIQEELIAECRAGLWG